MPLVHPSAEVLGSRNMLARYQICAPRLLFYLLSMTKYVLRLIAPPLPPTQQQQHKLCSFPLARPPRLEPPFRAPSTPSLHFVLRTCFLFFSPCPMAPIPLAFIIQPSLLSALLGCQRKKGPRSCFFNLPSGLASASEAPFHLQQLLLPFYHL